MQQKLYGRIDFHNNNFVKGWALRPGSAHEWPEVQVLEQGAVVAQFTPMIFRWDLYEYGHGSGGHGFIFPITARYLDGQAHELHFRFAENGEALEGSPVRIQATSESQHIPFQLSDLTGRKVLVLAPHPDDEALSCGGSIRLHRRKGDAVKVLFLTDGSKADTDHAYATADYVALRQDESRQAAALLGVDDLEFWDVPDRELNANDPATQAKLITVLQNYQPELIYLPSALDFHPDHRATAALLWTCIQQMRIHVKMAFYDYNRPININTLVDISAVVEEKRRACDVYVSQMHYYPYTEGALAYNKYRSLTVSKLAQYVEDFFVLDSSEIFEQPLEFFTRRQFLPVSTSSLSDYPLVSIITRTKDRPLILREALSSVLMQSYPNLEVIVINDGGSDISAVVDEFRPYMPIQHRNLEKPIGRSAAGNLGVSLSKGKYINFLDDDDILYFTHVERLAGYLHTTGEQFAYSDCELGTYQWNGERHTLKAPKSLYMGVYYDRDRLYLGNYIPIMTAMFTRELWDKSGQLDATLDTYEDWDLWLRMIRFATPQRVPGITAEYRILRERNLDEKALTLKFYEKHRDYWNLENISRLSMRLDVVESENRYLKNRMTELTEDRGAVAAHRDALQAELQQIYASQRWQVALKLSQVKQLIRRR
ncbi:MAG: PIG-L family deacetylase [Chloroflexota bacterium]